MRDTQFTITPDHLALLQKMWVSWENCEFGAPSIDCKRPYGNSDVLGDIREILGDTESSDDDLTELHAEMETVLQIVVRLNGAQAGDYVAPPYSSNWERV